MVETDECTVMLWLARELSGFGALCCLKHFKVGTPCKADRRLVEDCGDD